VPDKWAHWLQSHAEWSAAAAAAPAPGKGVGTISKGTGKATGAPAGTAGAAGGEAAGGEAAGGEAAGGEAAGGAQKHAVAKTKGGAAGARQRLVPPPERTSSRVMASVMTEAAAATTAAATTAAATTAAATTAAATTAAAKVTRAVAAKAPGPQQACRATPRLVAKTAGGKGGKPADSPSPSGVLGFSSKKRRRA